MANLRAMLPWIAFVAALLLLPRLFDSVLSLSILNQMGITIIFALSYNMLLGQGGMLSFGHAVYFGLGGFMAVHALNYIEEEVFSMPVILLPLIGGLFGLLFAVFIGSFSTRRAGTVFAMISLGIGEMIAACSLIFVGFFGGEEGISGDRTMAPEFFGFDFAQDIEVYYLIAVWVFVASMLMYLFSQTPAGRIANAVRDNPERAEFIGYSQRMVRFITFCGAGFFAGIAGGLFAINYEILTEENLNAITSGNILLMTYIGGTGYFAGPMVGAVLLTLLQTVLSNYTQLWQLYVGLLFVSTVMFMPTGLTGLLMIHATAWTSGRLKHLILPYITVGVPAFVLLGATVGLLEMLQFYNHTVVGEYEMTLYLLPVDTASIWPWLVTLLIALIAAVLVKVCMPQFRRAWESANAPMKELER